MRKLKFKNAGSNHISRALDVMKNHTPYININQGTIELQVNSFSSVENDIGTDVYTCSLPDGKKVKVLSGGVLTGPIFMPIRE